MCLSLCLCIRLCAGICLCVFIACEIKAVAIDDQDDQEWSVTAATYTGTCILDDIETFFDEDII